MNEIERLVALAEAIAAQLSDSDRGGWTLRYPETDEEDRENLREVTLHGPEKRKLKIELITFQTTGPRLHISGLYPCHMYPHRESAITHHDNPPKISAAAGRSARSIAIDIYRRLLPDYERHYQLTLERIAQRQAERERVLNTSRDIMAIGGSSGRVREPNEVVINPGPGLAYGQFIIWDDGQVNVQLTNLSHDQALAVAALITPARPRQSVEFEDSDLDILTDDEYHDLQQLRQALD